MLATSSAKILIVTTSNVLIIPPQSMILNLTASLRSPFPLVVPCCPSPLYYAKFGKRLPSALHHALPKSSMSTAMIPLNGRAFILATIVTPSRSATVETVASVSTPSSRSTSSERLKPLTTKSFCKPTNRSGRPCG